MPKLNIIKASAGSGKTYTLAYNYISKILKSPRMFEKILAVTFTNKATCQMKDRILSNLQNLKTNPEEENYITKLLNDGFKDTKEVAQKAKEAQLEILSDYNHFAVSTIDKFFTKIVRSFFNELKKDPSYEVVTSNEELIDNAIKDVVMSDSNSELLEPIFSQRVEEKGKSSDISYEFNPIKNLLIGKNIAEEYDFQSLSDKHKKDKELIQVLKERVMSEATAICSYLFKEDIKVSDYLGGAQGGIGANLIKLASGTTEKNEDGGGFKIGKKLESFIEGTTENIASSKSKHKELVNTLSKKLKEDLDSKLIPAVDNYNEHAKLAITTKLIDKNINLLPIVHLINEKYKENCKRDHIIAISEMPEIVSDITENENLAFLYMKLDAMFQTIMIDEFQDTSTKQWNGFRPIIHEICSILEEPDNLIIGDIKQAIYRWRGGNEELLREKVASEFPVGLSQQPLNSNFRSRENIIQFNNRLFSKITETGICCDYINFNGKTDIEEKVLDKIRLTYDGYKQEIGNEQKQKGGYVQYSFSVIPEDITGEIVNKIQESLEDGYSYSDIAVIVRNNSEATKTARKFSEVEIPFISCDSLLLSNSPAVNKMIVLFHLAVNPSDNIFLAKYNLLRDRNLKDSLTQEETEILSQAYTLPLIEAGSLVYRYFITESITDETSFMDAFLDLLHRMQTNKSMSLSEFVTWWDKGGNKESLNSPEGQNAVTIITIHKSKGLEYPIVIAPFVNWSFMPRKNELFCFKADEGSGYEKFGPLPIMFSSGCYYSYFKQAYLTEIIQSIIDNLNLLYVLVTRAEERLYLFCPADSKRNTDISVFLKYALEDDNGCWGTREHKVIKPDIIVDNNETVRDISPKTFEKRFLASSFKNENIIEGNLMHKVLSSINSLGELEEKLKEEVEAQGLEIERFSSFKDRILSCEKMREWFSKGWEVYNERGIIIPGCKVQKRPDRVIVKGENAIVIDYKFGKNIQDKHKEQVKEYMSLVKQLGYKNIEGYVYYVALNKIESLNS